MIGGRGENASCKCRRAHHLKLAAQTGSPLPNMSTTFMGKSSPDEDVCKLTPKSAEASSFG